MFEDLPNLGENKVLKHSENPLPKLVELGRGGGQDFLLEMEGKLVKLEIHDILFMSSFCILILEYITKSTQTLKILPSQTFKIL